MADHKRSAGDAGVYDFPNSKAARTDASLDPRVAGKLEEIISTGMLGRNELDHKIVAELAAYDPEDGVRILGQFENAGLENVRNKSGYLHGVMIRYRKEGMPRLDRDVFGRLDKMYRTSRIKAADLDQRVFDALATLPPSIALRTIDRFQSRCGEDVRNVSAFFMSMLRTEMANNGPGSGPGPAYSGGPEHGGPPPRGGYRDGPPPPYRDGPPPQGYRDAPPPPRERGGMYGGPPLAPPRGPPGGPAPYDAYDVGPPAAYRPGPGGPGPYDPYGPSDPYPPPRNGMPPMVALPAAHMGPSAAMHGHGDLLSPYAGGPAALQPLVPVPVPGQYVPAPVAPPAAMPGYPQQPPVSGRRSYAVDQATMGIRVTELHGMSVFAEYVHPAPALKLQQLWDGLGGAPNRLVSLLDDRSWEVLSDLAAPEALAVIDQVAEAMSRQELRNPNAFFMSCAKKYLQAMPPAPRGAQQPMVPDMGEYGRAPTQMDRMVPLAAPGHWDAPLQRGPPAPPAGGMSGGYEYDYGRAPPARGPPGGPPGGMGSPNGGISGLEILPEPAQQRAREAIARHYPAVTEATFDRGLCEGIRRLPYEDTMAVFDELMSADMSAVRNVTAYVMGMVRKRGR